MNIGPIGNSASPNVQALQKQAAPAQVQPKGRDNDGDSDNGAKEVQAPVSTVNLNGQKLGQVINITA